MSDHQRAAVHLATEPPCPNCGYCETTRCGVPASMNVSMSTREVTCQRCLLLSAGDIRRQSEEARDE